MKAYLPEESNRNLGSHTSGAPTLVLVDNLGMEVRTLGQRLVLARRKAGMTQAHVAKRLGVSRPAVLQWEHGKTTPESARIPKLAELYGVSAEWLWKGSVIKILPPERDLEYAQKNGARNENIDEVDARAAAGAGEVVEFPEVIAHWQLPSTVLRHATNAPADKIKILTVVGDSMPGLFSAFDKIIVDTSNLSPVPPGVFVIWETLGLVVKRVHYIQGSDPPRVVIMSDNPRYPPYERVLGEAHIQGRVIARLQWISGSENGNGAG